MSFTIRRFWVLATTVALASVVVACRPIDPEKCDTVDWYQTGVVDGERGRADRLDAFIETCGTVDVTPDVDAYLMGREEGLERFCTFETGLQYGRRGRLDPTELCRPGLREQVNQGWQLGGVIRQVQNDIDDVDAQLADVRALLEGDNVLSDDERERLWGEFDRLQRERERLEDYQAQIFEVLADYRLSISSIAVQGQGAAG